MPVTHRPAWLRGFRNEITRLVIDEAQRMYPEAIRFSFDTAIESIDLDRQRCRIQSAHECQTGELVSFSAAADVSIGGLGP